MQYLPHICLSTKILMPKQSNIANKGGNPTTKIWGIEETDERIVGTKK